jgi:predicted ATPase/tRNA A-37 threonylcarbamoyl transferase component Bud32
VTEQRLGRYVVLGRIGKGAMAEVFAGRLDGPGGFSRRVAIKRIHEHLCQQPLVREMLTSEGRLAAVLEHANIVQVYELFESDDAFSLVMEFADGGSVRALIDAARAQGQPVPGPVIARIGAEVCAGLAYAHQLTDLEGRPLEIVHRDLSPENILLTRSGGVKLSDFGLANARGKLERGAAAEVAGKPEYMPVEQYLGLPCDGRVDVFALGAVLYELATGQKAFPGGHEAARAKGQRPAPLATLRPDLPPELCQWVERALAEAREDRPTAEVLGAALARVSSAGPGALTVGALGRYVAQVLPPLDLAPLEDVHAASTPISSPSVGRPRRSFGREEDVAALQALFDAGHRAVVMLGAPGIGTTHVAKALRARRSAQGPAWFVSLATARDALGVALAVGQALEVPLAAAPSSAPDGLEQLGRALAAAGRALLVLDGCERVEDAVRQAVARWLAAAPQLQVLLTSQQRLASRPDLTLTPYELGPLPLDAAAQVFVARAREVRRDLLLQPEDERVRAIVARLDGLPLAVELAAAQLERDSLEAVGAAVASGRFPAGSPLAGLVNAALANLSPVERSAFEQCGVFSGSFSVAAAEAVVLLPRDAPRVRLVLQALADRSLVRRLGEDERGGQRYGMFEVFRAQALAALRRAGQLEPVTARHAHYFTREGATWAAGAQGHLGSSFRRTISQELDNLLAVHQRALEALPMTPREGNHALAAALVAEPVLTARGPLGLLLSLLDSALAACEPLDVHPPLRVRALIARGSLLRDLGRLTDAEADLARALTLALALGDRRLECFARAYRATLLIDQGRYELVEPELAQAQALAVEKGERRVEALVRGTCAVFALERGRLDEARQHSAAAMQLLSELGDRRLEAIGLGHLANLHLEEGRVEEAKACHLRALEMLDAVGDRLHRALFTGYLALDELFARRPAEARAGLETATRALAEVGEQRFGALFTGCLGVALAQLKDIAGAEAALTRAEQTLRELGDPVFLRAVQVHRACLSRARGEAVVLEPVPSERDNDVRLARLLAERLAA